PPAPRLDLDQRTTTAGGWSKITKRKLLWGAGIAVVAAAALGALLVHNVRFDDDAIVIAHRGAAGSAPENTLASVREALEEKADMVEIDVQETADGEVAVIHDSDLMKIAGVNLKIWDATTAQLADIDVGSHFDPEFAEERIPLLADVLQLCQGKAKVNIELKYYGHDEDLERRVAKIVEDNDMQDQIVLMSLKYDAVKKMKSLRPEWTVGLLTATSVGDLTQMEADFLAVNTGLVDGAFIRRAHRSGKDVYAWTVNDSTEMLRLLGLGVDGLITDYPGRARQALATRAGLNAAERLLLDVAFRFGVVPKKALSQADLQRETQTAVP
ncbi:MAG: glycerophosphodiester phosphodiesterase, partial [Planctomycetota bacterium]